LCQRLIRKAVTQKDDPQAPLCPYARVGPGLMDQRAMRDRVIKRNHLFQMPS